MKKILFGVLCCMCLPQVYGQDSIVATKVEPVKKDYVYKQKVAPQGIDNYLYAVHYFNNENVFNLRNVEVSKSDGFVTSLKVNPSGTSYAVTEMKKGKSKVSLYNLWEAQDKLHQFKGLDSVSAICYTPDAKHLLIAEANNLLFYNSRKKYELVDKMPLPFAPTEIVVSNNGHFLAAANGEKLVIWNLETKKIRKEFDFGVQVNDMAFSNDNSTLAVLTADGLLATYNTRDFLVKENFEAMGKAIACAFHPQDKYIAVATGDARITLLNMLDKEERLFVDNTDGGIFDIRFLHDYKDRVFLIYNTKNNIVFHLTSDLAPNYNKLLADEVNIRMNEWMKMMPGESLDQYKLRVNDETRAAQKRLFEEEISTRLADNMLDMSQISFGNYNPENNLLAVNFDNMPAIYLTVPTEEVNDFMEPGNLEFRNAKYGLTDADKFELIYADVYNKSTGKSYTFDNRSRKNLEYIQADENAVPLEYIQIANLEAIKLEQMKEDVVSLAKQDNIITDNTNISVNAEVVSDVDADGNNIMNYKIDFEYEVDPKFSAQEDFAPGKYKSGESGAASSMLKIVKNAFENDFAKYVQEGKKLQVNITGMADALGIHRVIPYDGCYGDFEQEPIYKDGDLSNITVTKKSGITQNEQLAFLRAVGVKEYITNNIDAINKMNTNYRYNIHLTEGKGGAYRRITVEFIFVDAF